MGMKLVKHVRRPTTRGKHLLRLVLIPQFSWILLVSYRSFCAVLTAQLLAGAYPWGINGYVGLPQN